MLRFLYAIFSFGNERLKLLNCLFFEVQQEFSCCELISHEEGPSLGGLQRLSSIHLPFLRGTEESFEKPQSGYFGWRNNQCSSEVRDANRQITENEFPWCRTITGQQRFTITFNYKPYCHLMYSASINKGNTHYYYFVSLRDAVQCSRSNVIPVRLMPKLNRN